MNDREITQRIAILAEQAMGDARLSNCQALWLTELGEEYTHDLFCAASRIREHFVGKRVRCCSIVAAKAGRCREDCAFCSQSKHYSTPVEGLTVLDEEKVFAAAMEAASNGAQSFGIVNSGYGPTDSEITDWATPIRRIRESGRIGVCASLGVLTEEQAHRLKEAGVQRYNHNLQTSRGHFPKIVTTHTYDQRLATLRHLKKAGISVCSGALFGMGETWEDRVALALELREIDPDVVPINFLIPIPGTPLADLEPLTPMECLKIIAVYRFLLPRQSIKIAGGREVHLRDLQSWIFFAGADSFLLGNYLTTCGRPPQDDHRMVRDLGLIMEGFAESALNTPSHRTPARMRPAYGSSKQPLPHVR